MGTQSKPAGFHPVSRNDGLFEERVHDAYRAKRKLTEPTVCSQCGAVFHKDAGSGSKLPPMHIGIFVPLVTAYTIIIPPVL